MFHTATVSDLRFNTNDVLKKARLYDILLLKNGRKSGLLLGPEQAEEYIRWKQSSSPATRIDAANEILKNMRRFQVRGPGDMSTTLDETTYE